MIAFHEVDHLPEPGVRVHHLVSRVLLFGQPLNRLLHGRPVIPGDVGDIVVSVFEVFILLEQWRLIDVIVGRDAVVVSDFGELPNVIEVIAADIDVEKDGIAIPVLLANQVIELFANRQPAL